MNSLRVRIAILLVVSIVSVVGLATFAAVRELGSPETQRLIELINRQILLAADAGKSLPGLPLLSEPLGGAPVERITNAIRADLAAAGTPIDIVVTRSDNGNLIASVPVGTTGWVAFPLPGIPMVGSEWALLFGYLLFITLASTGIAIFAASKLTRPLSMIEDAVAAVGSDGNLPSLPETTGTAEVRATASALNRLSRRLQLAVESRMRLVAAAGHDLRTPMTRMRLRAEFLPDEEEREAWVKDLDELAWLADSAIALVREETSASPSEPLALDEVVTQLAEELGSIGFRVTVSDTVAVTVGAGPLALRRALRNLMINSATHGGGACVSVKKEAGKAVLTIDDNGPGIPEELLAQVFEPFFRVDPARRQVVPGAGLGLSIAKEIIQRFHGTLRIRNKEGGGLSQEIVFPVSPAA